MLCEGLGCAGAGCGLSSSVQDTHKGQILANSAFFYEEILFARVS